MSVDRKEIDLIIRAALQGGKTLKDVTQSIEAIEKALDAQSAAAKRGESSIDELKATLESLKRTQDQLKDQAGLIGQFQKLADQIAKTAEKTDKAAKTYTAYKEKLDKAGESTDFQRDKLIRLGNAVERNQATLGRQRTEQEALTKALRDAGIEMGQLAEAESVVRQAAAALGLTINRTQQAISTYADDVRKAREAERAMGEQRAFDQKLQDAAKLNKAGEYVRFWTNALNAADATEQQIKVNEALRQTADKAIAAARGYRTLGTATKALAAPSSGLRDVIQGIISPAEQARTTLSGVETEVRQIGAAVSAITGPVADYRDQMQRLLAVQKAIGQQASMVDGYNKQISSLRQARAEFTQARALVLQYAEALRNSSGENTALANSLRMAEGALASAQQKLAGQISTTRGMRQAMRDAGLATNDLAATQSRLTGAAKGTVDALGQLTAAHRRHGDAVEKGGNSQNFFTSSGRTTLSLVQRIRGEVLAMAAAYVGLYGAIGGAQKTLEAFNKRQAIQNQLSISVGTSTSAIAEEWVYLQGQAERLGVSFEHLAEGYAKFFASGKLAGASRQEVRYIFETFTEIGRVAHLSKDDMNGVFRALEQMMSKTQIMSEELRGQLGDRLFGVFGIAKEALKKQFPDFDKALKEGKVGAEYILNIAEAYKRLVSGALPLATQSLQAQQERLNTTLFNFKLLIADSGFETEYTKLLKSLSDFFASDQGTKFAQDLSAGLSMVVQMLKWMVDNAQLVKETLIVGVLLLGARSAAGFAVGVVNVAGKLGILALAGTTAAVAIKNVGKAFGVVTALALGWEIGAILREKFLSVRLAGISLVVGMNELWVKMKYGAAIIWAELPNIVLDALSTVANGATSILRTILGAFAAAARGMGKNDLAMSIDKALKALEFRTNRIGSASGALTRQMDADLARIREIGNEMAAEAMNPGVTTKKPGVATAKPDQSTIKGKKGDDEKRIKLKEQIENELKAIEAKIERNEHDSLAKRLEAIDDTYGKLVKKIAKLGGAEAKAMNEELASMVGQLKIQETRKFNDALQKEQEGIQAKLEQVDATAGRRTKTDIDKRLAAVRLGYEQTYRDIAEYRRKLELNNRPTAPADLMKGRLDAGILAIQNLERQKYFEDSINSVLEERKAKLDTIAVMEKTGLITAVQARERSAQVVAETQPKIEALVAEGLKYVDAMMLAAEAAGASVTAIETMKAKLIEARESAKGLRTEFLSAAQVNEMLANGATGAFQKMTDAIGGAIRGVNTWGDAIRATRNAFLTFAADFMLEIGKMILKQALLNALRDATAGSQGGIGGMISGAVNALMKHGGGTVGNYGARRSVPSEWFANAPRFHGGGVPGLAADEYAAVLKKNEEVLTESDPRNVLNGGKSAGSTASAQGLKIINMIDSASVVSEGLATQQGEKAIFNFIRANRTGLKQILA